MTNNIEDSDYKGDSKKTEDTTDSRDLDRIEHRVDKLHDELDKIKQTGRAVRADMEDLKESEWDKDMEQVMRILQKSGLLEQRVERGDHNIVRGK